MTARWLLARRLCQLGLLGLFLTGPLTGWWVVKGTLASSVTLGRLPLTDPLILLQSLLAGHRPERAALVGAGIVAAFYALLRGRLYCSWVCPLNMVTDAAGWLRLRLGLTERSLLLSRRARLWVLGGCLAVSAVSGTIAWEAVNPVTMLHRALVFGALPTAGLVAGLVFLLDLTAGARSWCGHLCPVGAFYGLLGRFSLIKISAARRAACDDCGDCYRVCPEPQVLTPALRGAARGIGPVVASSDCTACGRCLDVCPHDVFAFGLGREKSEK
ncbi:MAG TPA: quinol dehydrogenase ferredoxin subunit NapH [Patescibacteria group bacterium]|nr:quinol dehydrogenase ferredoxin subunit NapH [Patescibacteria group bacterium]